MIQLLFFALFIGHASFLQASDDAFDKANTLYQQENFVAAYDAYKNIQPTTNATQFNMGNCAFKLGKKGLALAHWRRAENNWGIWGIEELRHNIAHLKKQISPTMQEPEISTLSQALSSTYQSTRNFMIPFVRSLPLLTLQIIVLLIWAILFLSFRFFRKFTPKSLLVCMFVIFSIAAGILAIKYNLNNKKYGIVISEHATLFSGPGDNFSNLGQLPEVTELVILKQSGDFYKIRQAGKLGWINKNDVECF